MRYSIPNPQERPHQHACHGRSSIKFKGPRILDAINFTRRYYRNSSRDLLFPTKRKHTVSAMTRQGKVERTSFRWQLVHMARHTATFLQLQARTNTPLPKPPEKRQATGHQRAPTPNEIQPAGHEIRSIATLTPRSSRKVELRAHERLFRKNHPNNIETKQSKANPKQAARCSIAIPAESTQISQTRCPSPSTDVGTTSSTIAQTRSATTRWARRKTIKPSNKKPLAHPNPTQYPGGYPLREHRT